MSQRNMPAVNARLVDSDSARVSRSRITLMACGSQQIVVRTAPTAPITSINSGNWGGDISFLAIRLPPIYRRRDVAFVTAEAVDVTCEVPGRRRARGAISALRRGGVFGYIRAPFGHNQAGQQHKEPGRRLAGS